MLHRLEVRADDLTPEDQTGHWELQFYTVSIWAPFGKPFIDTVQIGQRIVVTGRLDSVYHETFTGYQPIVSIIAERVITTNDPAQDTSNTEPPLRLTTGPEFVTTSFTYSRVAPSAPPPAMPLPAARPSGRADAPPAGGRGPAGQRRGAGRPGARRSDHATARQRPSSRCVAAPSSRRRPRPGNDVPTGAAPVNQFQKNKPSPVKLAGTASL